MNRISNGARVSAARSWLWQLVLALYVASALPAAAADRQTTSIEFPGAANTVVYAVNNARQYVGFARVAGGSSHAVFFDGQRFEWLDPNGPVGTAARSYAYSINDLGEIAGGLEDTAGIWRGYVRRADGAIELIEFPGAAGTEAYGINHAGHVIGVYFDAAGATHAFTWRQGVYANADLAGAAVTVPLSINDRDQIVGEAVVTEGTLGYGYMQLPHGRVRWFSAPGAAPEQTFFISINNQRTVLCSYEDKEGAWFNFIQRGRQVETFDLPAGFGSSFTSAQTINDHEDIVGYYVDAAGLLHGFLSMAPSRVR